MKGSLKLALLLGMVIMLVFSVASVVSAAPFTMAGVDDIEGIADKDYTLFSEDDCRFCHGQNTADRHHLAAAALSQDCTFCHDTSSGVVVVPMSRTCSDCHPTSWHHTSNLAQAGECAACHEPYLIANQGTGYGPNAPEVVTYEKSLVTPTTADCANCHNDYEDVEVLDPLTPGNNANQVSHHDTVTMQCGFCHGDNQELDIRICESCHTVSTLHQIVGHVDSNDKCVGCHGTYMDSMPPLYPADPAIADGGVSPKSALKYATVYITGQNFGSVAPSLSSAYGVYLTASNGAVAKAAAKSWSDTVITVQVPSVAPGNYSVQVRTTGGESNMPTLSVVAAPTITKLTGTGGTNATFGTAWGLPGTTVTINGTGYSMGVTNVTMANGGTVYTLPATYVNDTTVKAVIPGNALPGTYSVKITTAVGTSAAKSFTVVADPRVNSISPTSGIAGQTITAIGYNMVLISKTPPACSVKFYNNATDTVPVATVVPATAASTKVTFKVPAIAKKLYYVKIDNCYSQSNAVNFTVK